MIERLRVQDLAIVEDVSVAFSEGLNILTGETGAGKSIIIGAIGLLTGRRADRSLIRAGADQCQVEALFSLGSPREVDRCLDEAGLPICEDGQLLIRRTVSASGGGRVLINDSVATVQTLRKIGALLVDLHGPHDNQSLFDPAFQLDALDSFGEHAAERGAYKELFAEQSRLLRLRAKLAGDDAAAEREIDLLSYQVGEIEDAQLTEADGEELIREHANAANAEQLLMIGQQALQRLSESDSSMLDLIAGVQNDIREMSRLVEGATDSWMEEARAIAVQTQELARSLVDYVSGIDVSPEHLTALESRMALVQRLRGKYGKDVGEILAFLEKARARLEELSSRGERLAEADAELAALEPRISAAANTLSEKRLEVARGLERAILEELRDLGFKEARLEVRIRKTPYGPTGADAVDIGFAPNPGEPMRALRDIASSGEISRVMLALKSVLADHDRIPVLVFDEIDANIGGEIGNAVGAKMRQIGGRNHQVVCITHLPQVAVYGKSHAVVAKSTIEGRTLVFIEKVEDEARTREVARMLGGAELTSVTLDHAAEMLRNVEES